MNHTVFRKSRNVLFAKWMETNNSHRRVFCFILFAQNLDSFDVSFFGDAILVCVRQKCQVVLSKLGNVLWKLVLFDRTLQSYFFFVYFLAIEKNSFFFCLFTFFVVDFELETPSGWASRPSLVNTPLAEESEESLN